MTTRDPVTGLVCWVAHRLISNYWFLALCAVTSAPIAFAVLLHFDRNGLSSWLLERDLAPVQTADAAKEVAGTVAAIDAAFVTLYFSISLIVLTIAAGNLGVRLIDRWLAKRLVRVSIAGLSFTLIFAVLTLAAIDSEAALADTPLGTVAATIGFLLVNIAMLAVALHDLGRTMFVDKAIDAIARDAEVPRVVVEGAKAFTGNFAQKIPASRAGYVEGVDLGRLARRLSAHPGTVRICVAPGQHVLEGETLIALEHAVTEADALKQAIPIGSFRSNSQGAVFQIRLLVEIAARALSPAINDFYTALATADALAEVLAGHCDSWVDEGAMPVHAEHPRFELPGQDFRGLFEDPLKAFRQAAADYPSVAIRMIGNYRRIATRLQEAGCAPELVAFLRGEAGALADHAASRAQFDQDRADILRSLSQWNDRPAEQQDITQ